MRDAFAALSGGRRLPTEATRSDEVAYSNLVEEYRTARGDGLVIDECRDYGEFHRAKDLTLTVGDEITLSVDERGRSTRTVVFRLSARDDRIAEAAECVKRAATSAGLRFVSEQAS